MTIHLSFLAAVALAGAAAFIAEATVHRVAWLRRLYIPEPLVGGLLLALIFLLLRTVGVVVHFPTHGYTVDFLVALLTTNMGLHITPQILRRGFPLFLLFLGSGAGLAVIQLLLALPLASLGPHPLYTAILAGPLSFVGAPFNLNPPSQTSPIAHLFQGSYPNLESVAQGVMMVGVLAAIGGAGLMGRHFFQLAQEEPPIPAPSDRHPHLSLSRFAFEETGLVVLILCLIALAFALQRVLLAAIPGFKEDYLPIILIAFLLGALFRLGFTASLGKERFPEQSLTILLLGPTMSIVFAYAVMSIPLHHLALLSPRLLVIALLSVAASAVVARLAFSRFRRHTDPYYAAVIATVFFAVTTGWGPIAMGFLRRSINAEGPVEPMPAILPLNAFYLFPWMMIWLTHLLTAFFG